MRTFAAGIPNRSFCCFLFTGWRQSKTEHGSEHEMKNACLYHRVSARRHFEHLKKQMKKEINCTTDLCVNLKTILRSGKRARSGKSYLGILHRDEASEEFNFDEHYTFIEVLPITEKHIPHVFNMSNEICKALGGLIEKG